jgi:hypothetical protein
MPLLDQAQKIYRGVLEGGASCYWYGDVLIADGEASLRSPEKDPKHCEPPVVQQPYAVGWEAAGGGSPYVGVMGPQQKTVAYTDCSGFVAWCIRQENRVAYDSIPRQVAAISEQALRDYLAKVDRGHGQNWPSAADYAALGASQAEAPFQSLGGGEEILTRMQPGDILAWGLLPKSGDTGHVVIVAQTPVQSAGVWNVQVLDSSLLKHGNDSRPGGTGVGLGTIALQPPGSDNRWQVNFDAVGDHFRPVEYLSVLRLT